MNIDALAITTGAASAQQRTFYDIVGRSSTDSQGTTTTYDARGRVISRESTTGTKSAGFLRTSGWLLAQQR